MGPPQAAVLQDKPAPARVLYRLQGISASVPGAPPPSLTLVSVLLFLTASPHSAYLAVFALS